MVEIAVDSTIAGSMKLNAHSWYSRIWSPLFVSQKRFVCL